MTCRWHRHSARVQYRDTDQMGVAHHSCYINWFETGRTEWLRCYGVPYDRLEAAGLMLPVMDVQAHYAASAYFDDRYGVFTCVTTFTPVRLGFDYEVRRLPQDDDLPPDAAVAAPSGLLLARGSSTHVFVDQTWKTVRFDRKAPDLYHQMQQAVSGT